VISVTASRTATPSPTGTQSPTATRTPFTSPSGLAGDLNQDGRVDTLDVQIEINVIFGKEPDNSVVLRADVNRDGIINVQDVQAIVNIMTGW
jgi:hypothetical protein